MRELSFRGYLQQQLCELSGCNSKSLYKFGGLARNNVRLRNVLCLYMSYYVQDKLKNQLCKKYPYLAQACQSLDGTEPEQFDDGFSEYQTIYNNYLAGKNHKANEDKIKSLMQKRIVEVQTEKSITNYRIYKMLKLNPGNVNAFLKHGDVTKMGLDTVRRILAFVNDYPAGHVREA